MTVEMALLGLLVEEPLHGYAIEQRIVERNMRDWTPIGFSSIYQALDRLAAAGLTEVRVDPSPGRGRPRRVHHVTATGRRRWRTRALAALADVSAEPSEFLLALSGLPLLSLADAVDALRRRHDELRARLTRLDRRLAAVRPVPAHVEAMFAHTRARLRAERDWTRRYVATLEDRKGA